MLSRLLPVLAVLLGACASMQRPPPAPDAPVAELLGLSQSAIRERMGRSQSEGVSFITLTLEDGVAVAVGDIRMLSTPSACPRGYMRGLLFVNGDLRGLQVVFHDDRLAGLADANGPLAAEDRISLPCFRNRSGFPQRTSDLLLVPLAPIFVPTAVAVAGTNALLDATSQRRRAFAALRFGGPLPGGVDGFVADHPDVVHVVSRDGEDAELVLELFYRGQVVAPERETNSVRLQVRGGVLTRVSSWPQYPCILGPDQSVTCPRAKTR